MTLNHDQMRPDASAAAIGAERACRHCSALFAPRKSWQVYCSKECRTAFNAAQGDGGLRAKVTGARLLKGGGVSVTLRFPEADKDAATQLEPGRTVELTIVEPQQ